MKYLLDTHVILWYLIGDKRVPKKIRDIVNDDNNQIFYSIVSPWEVEIKHQKRDSFTLTAKQLDFLCYQNFMNNLPIKLSHVYKLEDLNRIEGSKKHEDPFDRILLAQSLDENMIFITHDKNLAGYQLNNILMF